MTKKSSTLLSSILGCVLLIVGIAALCLPAPLLGIHPVAWFVAAAFLFAGSTWSNSARKNSQQEPQEPSDNTSATTAPFEDSSSPKL